MSPKYGLKSAAPLDESSQMAATTTSELATSDLAGKRRHIRDEFIPGHDSLLAAVGSMPGTSVL